jgi:hypothetical protein
VRPALIRSIRYLVLHPAALLGWLVGLVVLVAAIVAVPMLAPSIPALSALRGNTAPIATEDFLRGNRDFNADLMWSSLNTDAQARMKDQGGSLEDLQRQMDSSRQSGMKLEEISYIGSKLLPDGTSTQFYLVGIRQRARTDIDYQPYMFTLDRDGKIAKVQ